MTVRRRFDRRRMTVRSSARIDEDDCSGSSLRPFPETCPLFASLLFVPFLQIGASTQSQYPPFQIEIAWLSIAQIYVLFALLFFAALSALSALLVRMKIFQAIKLGETT